jgi:RNA polymerase sigma-70 factor (ECF subfamily)
MAGTKSGDADAPAAGPPSLETLFTSHESALLRYARRLVSNNETAQDIVQEAFMKLHADRETVRQPQAWLYRTVHNMALNHLRDNRKIVRLHGDAAAQMELPDTQPLPDEQIQRLEAIGQTRLCLEAMDPRRRELLRLKFAEGLSYQQISERTSLSVSNVGYLLHHALKDLAAGLKGAGLTP